MLPSTLFRVCYILPSHAQTSRSWSKKRKIEKQLVLLALMIFAIDDNGVLHARVFFSLLSF